MKIFWNLILCVVVFVSGFAGLTAVFFANENLTTFAYKNLWKVDSEKVRALEEIDKQIEDTDNLIEEADKEINSYIISVNGLDIYKDITTEDSFMIETNARTHTYRYNTNENKYILKMNISTEYSSTVAEQVERYCPVDLEIKSLKILKRYQINMGEEKHFTDVYLKLILSEEFKTEYNNFFCGEKVEDFSNITEADYTSISKLSFELNSSNEITKLVLENYLEEVKA